MSGLTNTHQNIVLFERIVRDAVDKGWSMFGTIPFTMKGGADWAVVDKGASTGHTPLLTVIGKGESERYRAYYEFEQVIFDHEFCHKIWDTPKLANAGELHFETASGKSEWEYHIRELAAAKYRMDYLQNNWKSPLDA